LLTGAMEAVLVPVAAAAMVAPAVAVLVGLPTAC